MNLLLPSKMRALLSLILDPKYQFAEAIMAIKTNKIDIESLKLGDIVQNLGSGNAYTVTRITESGRVFALREIEVSNAGEWVLVQIDKNHNIKREGLWQPGIDTNHK